MECIRPLKAGFDQKGGITFSYPQTQVAMDIFKLPCRKCLPCRLKNAREKAVRALHESKMHEGNIFLTLTYNDDSLPSQKLIYQDWQKFIRKLRRSQAQKIPTMVTGEYGELNKRPHWHALIFNYYPEDARKEFTTSRGDTHYSSETLSKLWGYGFVSFSDLTLESANYVTRYAAKKLVHGKDQDHDFHPIHKTSSRYAIGRSWIEKYYEQTFTHGYVTLPGGIRAGIPRYYQDWCKKYQPDLYIKYLTTIKDEQKLKAEQNSRKEELEYISTMFNKDYRTQHKVLKRPNVKERILQSKFKQLQENLKL